MAGSESLEKTCLELFWQFMQVAVLTILPPLEKELLYLEPTSLLRCKLRAVWGASIVVGRAMHKSCSASQMLALSATASSTQTL
jgi:hypothetical protein